MRNDTITIRYSNGHSVQVQTDSQMTAYERVGDILYPQFPDMLTDTLGKRVLVWPSVVDADRDGNGSLALAELIGG